MKSALALLAVLAVLASTHASIAQETCGAVITLPAHGGETQRYSFGTPDPAAGPPLAALVLLAGGGGTVDLDERGCARALTGNTLTRNVPALRAAGFATALVDSPSDHRGEDGLAGFRAHPAHAEDLGAVIADVRARTGLPVHVVGSSRGTISAANAGARLSVPAAPDGVILFSPITAGRAGGMKEWVAQTVFDVPLGELRMPILVVAHESDRCIRTPPRKAADIAVRTNGSREDTVIVTGGPEASANVSGVEACQGRFPHGFGGQDERVIALIGDFVRKTARR